MDASRQGEQFINRFVKKRTAKLLKNPVSHLKGFFLILTRMFPGRNIRFLIMPESKILFGRRQETFDPKSDSSTQFSIASEMTEDEVFHVYPWVFEPIQAPKQRTCHTEDFIVSIQTSVKRGSRRIGENGGSDILTRMEAFVSASIRSLSRCLYRDCVFRQRRG